MSEYLLEKLKSYGQSDWYPLHMPGHKRQISYFTDAFSIDITEIEGFDNLHHPEGLLLEAQKRAAQLYHSEESFFLVNGSTCGILASISAAVSRGGRILMARNCHKAAYHGVFLNGLEAVYLYPGLDMLRGISGVISPEQVQAALDQYEDVQAVLVTSPTYDGVVSDIQGIAQVVHQAGKLLIVDEAHGAHLVMHSYFPESAVKCGADLVINSLHKTMPSLTQTALLHVNGPRVNRALLRKYLDIYQSSSPSYVLMAGMDACITQMCSQGEALFDRFVVRLERMRRNLKKLQCLHLVDGRESGLSSFAFDRSKVLISTENCGLNGPGLADILRKKYRLEPEMAAERYVTAIMTVCDTAEGFDRLEKALLEIDRELMAGRPGAAAGSAEEVMGRGAAGSLTRELSWGEMDMTIEAAENSSGEQVLLAMSAGRVSQEFVYLYPPGIPLLVPGERIPERLPERLSEYKKAGFTLQGLEDYEGRMIRVLTYS